MLPALLGVLPEIPAFLFPMNTQNATELNKLGIGQFRYSATVCRKPPRFMAPWGAVQHSHVPLSSLMARR